MPKKQEGTVSAGESNEILVALSLLAVQPAGELFLFEIPPYSAQNDTSNKENDSLKLKKELETKLANISPRLRLAHDMKGASISLKVLFMIGKGEAEKDVDNMLKWFLDIFKVATGADDCAICDLRVLKKRLNHHKGMIGLSVKVSGNYGDIERATFEIHSLLKTGTTPNNLDYCLNGVKQVQDKIQDIVEPKFITPK